MVKQAEKSPNAETLKRNEAKWSKVLMESGWTAIPSVIIERQQALGLDSLDINILCYLTTFWWIPNNVPHPSIGTIANAIGVSARTIQKRIAAMEKVGLLAREQRRKTRVGSDTNLYRFDGLIRAVTPYAKEKLEERARREKEDRQRLTRKKPVLTVIK
jgi:hypothetical protein